jgi:hypothetical protein
MMEFFEAKCPWHIQIGSLFIAPGRVPNTGTVWLGEINGRQGSEIKTDELAEVPQAGQLFGFLRRQPTALCQPPPGFPPGAAGSAEEDGQVAIFFQAGYVINGHVLRPARVIVKQWSGN